MCRPTQQSVVDEMAEDAEIRLIRRGVAAGDLAQAIAERDKVRVRYPLKFAVRIQPFLGHVLQEIAEPRRRRTRPWREYGPDACGFVEGSGDDALAIWAELRTGYPAGMALERGQKLAGRRLPDPRGFVERSGDDALAIWAELRTAYLLGMALERGQKLAALRLPEPRGLVV